MRLCVFLTNKRTAFLSGVLIQLKINAGNEAASLSERAASLPLSLCMWLGEDSAVCVARMQHKLLCFFFFFFLAEPLAGLCIVPLSFLRQPVSAKGENYSRLDRNLEQQLLLDDQLREQRWIGVASVLWEAVACSLYAAFC